MHGHEDAIDPGERQPEVNFAERLIEAAAKHFGKPEEQGAEYGKCRGNTHDQVKVTSDEVVTRRGSGKVLTREEQSGEAAGEKERNETDGEKHGAAIYAPGASITH